MFRFVHESVEGEKPLSHPLPLNSHDIGFIIHFPDFLPLYPVFTIHAIADGHDQDVVVPDNLITIAEVRGGLKRFKLLRWLYLSPHVFRRCYQVITQSFKYLNFTKMSSEFRFYHQKILSTFISKHHLKELPTKIVLTSFFCCLGGFSACIAPTCYCKFMVQICAVSKNTHRFPIARRLATFAGGYVELQGRVYHLEN